MAPSVGAPWSFLSSGTACRFGRVPCTRHVPRKPAVLSPRPPRRRRRPPTIRPPRHLHSQKKKARHNRRASRRPGAGERSRSHPGSYGRFILARYGSSLRAARRRSWEGHSGCESPHAFPGRGAPWTTPQWRRAPSGQRWAARTRTATRRHGRGVAHSAAALRAGPNYRAQRAPLRTGPLSVPGERRKRPRVGDTVLSSEVSMMALAVAAHCMMDTEPSRPVRPWEDALGRGRAFGQTMPPWPTTKSCPPKYSRKCKGAERPMRRSRSDQLSSFGSVPALHLRPDESESCASGLDRVAPAGRKSRILARHRIAFLCTGPLLVSFES